jgi:Skp family chaperone for outer membrane proteins
MRILFIFFLIATSKIVTAQNKVCFINSAAVYAVLPDTKKAQEDIEQYRTNLSNDYNKLKQDLNEHYEKFVRDSAKMTPAVKEFQRKSLQTEISTFSSKESEFQSLVDAKTEELNKVLTDKVMVATKKVAQANGYHHILSVDIAIIYPKEDEITDKVKVELGIK